MSVKRLHEPPGDVVEKVLRRAEVAKMARKLQDRLALATFKTKRGWEALDINAMEPHIEQELRRKRPLSSSGTLSDSSSSASERHYISEALASSPLPAPFFSDDLYGPRAGSRRPQRRTFQSTFPDSYPDAGTKQKKPRVRAGSMAAPKADISRATWKSTHRLPDSSPVYHRQHAQYPVSHGANLSFVSEVPTVPDSPTFGVGSDVEDPQLPLHSFQVTASAMRSSPPRTPPPNRGRGGRPRRGEPAGREPVAGKEGADLLLYLATSPSPAVQITRPQVVPPSTPPSNHTALPSSMMSTPGGGFLNGFSTPGQQFNFADFVNITPSPAQGAWGPRTPGIAKTPLAAKEARRRLNFESLMPPSSGSPSLGQLGRGGGVKETGLGMELGGDLIP